MNDVRLRKQLLEQSMDMCGEGPKGLVVAVEAMNVDDEESPFGDCGLGE